MAITLEEVKRRYPIHWLVWNNQHEDLKNSLEANQFTNEDIELKDPRGRTPLLLAVTLGRVEAARLLLAAGADVNCEKDGWTAVQEATATGSAELLSLVLGRRDARRHAARAGGIPDLLRRLSLAPDFYVEMKWEFTSWVPLVSRMCPFDTYKVYKRGGNVRVDTTLVGFENNRWQRGDRTYIFRGQGTSARLVELDHELRTAWEERVGPPATPTTPATPGAPPAAPPDAPAPPPRAVQQRLAAPLAINYLDTDKISFERNKSGIWGWRQDKTESVNGYECKVFSANNVELVSSTRTEHLPRGDAARRAAPRAPLAGLLALADRDEPARSSPSTPLLTPDQEESPDSGGGGGRPLEEAAPLSWEEYFSEAAPPRDIGRPRELTTKVQKFKATLWLCEDYPLELQEQIMPILDLMAAMSSPHFVKLKDFVQMQLPAGFPVKIEIPLFHVLNARITFGNIFATEARVPCVECVPEGERLACLVDDACFEAGRGYRDAAHAPAPPDGEEGLLQYAIEQSLMEAGTHRDQVDVWEALRGARPASPASPAPPASPASPAPLPRDLLAHEERQLQRAIEASLSLSLGAGVGGAGAGAGWPGPGAGAGADEPGGADEDELAAALAASAREAAARASQLEEEQRALDEALRLSLLDK